MPCAASQAFDYVLILRDPMERMNSYAMLQEPLARISSCLAQRDARAGAVLVLGVRGVRCAESACSRRQHTVPHLPCETRADLQAVVWIGHQVRVQVRLQKVSCGTRPASRTSEAVVVVAVGTSASSFF